MPDPRPMTEAPRRGAPDDRDYMSLWEFSRLPSAAHHAVWQAHRNGTVDAVPFSENQPNGILRYHRAQVMEILRTLKEKEGSRALRPLPEAREEHRRVRHGRHPGALALRA